MKTTAWIVHNCRFAQPIASTANSPGLQLPPIPEGMIRLTHFTSERSAQQILASNFSYKGMVSTTTDAFADNAGILGLIQTGKVGAFTRESFGGGQAVVLMDMPFASYKAHSGIFAEQPEIDNRCILGYVRRSNMQLVPNPKYNPNTVGAIRRRQPPWAKPFPAPVPAPVSVLQNQEQTGIDIF